MAPSESFSFNVLASCFLGPRSPVFEALDELAAALSHGGGQLVVCTPTTMPERQFQQLQVPFHLATQGKYLESATAAPIRATGRIDIQELVALDKAWGAQELSKDLDSWVDRAVGVWENAFDILKPTTLLTWGDTIPLSRLHLRIGQRWQIPTYVLERGVFSDTLTLSTMGQVALSNLNTSPSLIRKLPRSTLKRVSRQLIERYGAGDLSSTVRKNDIPTFLYLGSFDEGSGSILSGPLFGEPPASWVRSSRQGLIELIAALDDHLENYLLLVKPHPATKITFVPTPRRGQLVVIPDDEHVDQLIRRADVCVTLVSTLQIKSLVLGTPTVVLGQSFLAGRLAVYEVTENRRLAAILIKALNRENWDAMYQRGIEAISSAYELDMVGINSEVPTGLKIADIANLLQRLQNHRGVATLSASDRLKQFFRVLGPLQASG